MPFIGSHVKAKNTRESRATGISLSIMMGFVVLAMGGLYLWRLHHFKHTIATVNAVWNEDLHKSRGRSPVTMAKISFTRVAPSGQSFDCDVSAIIGFPEDGYQIGDKVEIVPATGTCERLDVIGRSKSSSGKP